MHPEMRWSIVSVLVLQNLHLGFNPIMKNISLKISSEKVLTLCGNNELFSLCLKPGTSQPLMGVMYIYLSLLASKGVLTM